MSTVCAILPYLSAVGIKTDLCVSTAGHDFRPDYKGLSVFKRRYYACKPLHMANTAIEILL